MNRQGTSASSRRKNQLLLTLVVLFVAFLARAPFCSGDLFLFDAADYIRAIHGGFWPQYTASDSMSAVAFLHKFRADDRFREHPWGCIYQSGDGAALRHFHVPASFYLPAIADAVGWGREAQRLLVAGISAGTAAMVFVILSVAGVPLWIAFLAGLLLSVSPVLVLAGTTLSPHTLFSAVALVCVFSICTWVETRHDRWLLVFAVSLGAALATLELSPLLVIAILSILLLAWMQSRESLNPISRAKLAGAFCAGVAVAIVLWPGGLLRGGYLMSYGVFIFQGLFRSGIYFQQRGFPLSVYRLGQGWAMGSALGSLLIFGIYAAIRIRKSMLLSGFAVFAALLFAQGLANGFRNPTYASHAVFAIVLTGALGAYLLLKQSRQPDRLAGQAALILMILMTVSQAVAWARTSPAEVSRDSRRVAGAIEEIRSKFPPGTQFVVSEDPQAFIAYAPDLRFASAANVHSPAPEPWISLKGYYLLFDMEAAVPPPGVAFCSPGRLKEFGFVVSCAAI